MTPSKCQPYRIQYEIDYEGIISEGEIIGPLGAIFFAIDEIGFLMNTGNADIVLEKCRIGISRRWCGGIKQTSAEKWVRFCTDVQEEGSQLPDF